MARWVPDARDGLDRLVADLVELFASAERRLTTALAAQARAGIDAGDGPARALRLGELRTEAERVARWLGQTSPEVLERIVATAAREGADAALAELTALVGTTGTETAAAVAPGAGAAVVSTDRRAAGARAAALIRADLSSAMANVTARVLRFPDDVYRRAVATASTDVVLGLGGTTTSAQQQAWTMLVRQGVTGFTDTAGRRWNLASYVEMATRSATRRAYDDAKVATMRENGVDLVSVVVGNRACEKCARWAGKILRTDDGPTGRIEVQAVTGGTVTVNVAGTLDEAKAAGWRHPNCRCATVAYLPGLSVVEDVTTYDPEAEAARARLRELEREVRKAKLEAAAAPPDARQGANRKVRALQAKIRDHVTETGLIRQRRREQPNLGNVA
jgi:hypothetical protein